MKKIKVNLGGRSYNILIGRDTLKDIGSAIKKLSIGSDAVIITNSTIKNKYGVLLARSLLKEKIGAFFISIADTEKSKSLGVAGGIINSIAAYDRKKKIFIIALGGGVVGDLAGFVASVYKRGIPYIQVPTTLLAQIDSAIGGKTGVDLKEGKNLVGAFYQPRLVFSDISLLKSLNARQIRTGLSEALKYGIIKDKGLFSYLEKQHKRLLRKDPAALEFVASRCSNIKAKIVSLDEREKKQIRTILNFGHTFGHAIEAASGYRGYNHGEAVALGMLCANDLSLRLGLVNNSVSARIGRAIKSVGLPTEIKRVSLNKIIGAYYHDKKFNAEINRFVLIKGIAEALVKENIPAKLIRDVLAARMGNV